jgi:hypothetical protein
MSVCEDLIKEEPIIPDSYKIAVANYHLCRLSAERRYRKRISALTEWIKRKKPSYATECFIDSCLEIACIDAENFANKLFHENPTLTSLEEWGLV